MDLRAFVAVALPRETVRALSEFRRALVEESPGWAGEKWVPDRNLHLTLKFVAKLPEEMLPQISEALSTASSTQRPFKMLLTGPRAVPSERRAKMLWARIGDGSEQCRELAERVEDALADLGFEREPRGFKGHVTLARARRDRKVSHDALEQAWEAAFGASRASFAVVSVGSVTLFSSRTEAAGPVYEALGTWALSSD